MKKLTLLITILIYASTSFAKTIGGDTTMMTLSDSAKRQTQLTNTVDSLKQQLQLTQYDSLKSPIYTQIAAEYLNYDKIADKRLKLTFQNQALNYTYLALHMYSRYNDTTGLRLCFNNLSRVYRAQHKYPQAKWFIIQSNSLSRLKGDVPNIMASLIEMAAIKMEIKDYSLAMRDLDEALNLSTVNHYPKVESTVQVSYALLYSHLQKFDKEAIALKRHEFIDDSIRKNELAAVVVTTKAPDSLQVKKKAISPTGRKAYKGSSAKRIASL